MSTKNFHLCSQIGAATVDRTRFSYLPSTNFNPINYSGVLVRAHMPSFIFTEEVFIQSLIFCSTFLSRVCLIEVTVFHNSHRAIRCHAGKSTWLFKLLYNLLNHFIHRGTAIVPHYNNCGLHQSSFHYRDNDEDALDASKTHPEIDSIG